MLLKELLLIPNKFYVFCIDLTLNTSFYEHQLQADNISTICLLSKLLADQIFWNFQSETVHSEYKTHIYAVYFRPI